MSASIGIMGCGWLGFPLAKVLVKNGYEIHGSTTSKEKIPELEAAGIEAFCIDLSENGIEGPISAFLKPISTLIVNVPPRLRIAPQESYVQKMQFLLDAITASEVEKVIFISSTSVYGDIEGDVTESTTPAPSSASGKQLLLAEKLFTQTPNLQTSIVRFGGLIGPHRHPVTNLSKKKQLTNGNFPINLIHLDDCIRIITTIIEKAYWGELFNGVYPYYPSKRDFYTQESIKMGLPKPAYGIENRKKGKKVISDRLLNVKKFTFMTSVLSSFTTEK